jgi:uncharacterized membrane protein YphA (DoxX/SURF4 family)
MPHCDTSAIAIEYECCSQHDGELGRRHRETLGLGVPTGPVEKQTQDELTISAGNAWRFEKAFTLRGNGDCAILPAANWNQIQFRLVRTSARARFKWRDRMNTLLWVLQVLLALAFFAHGCLFLFPPAAIVDQMNASLPRWFQLFIGVAEILAAVGLTLPGFARIQPWLVSCAAAGIMIVMICATIFHLSRGEVSSAVITVVLLAMATFVAYLRWRVAPIQPRLVK